MSLIRTKSQKVEYPETDGRPMGETDLHRRWMIRLLDILQHRYRGLRVYVASNLLVYYEEGAPMYYVVPDEFVVKDCDPHDRRVFKTWEEGKTPDCVIEVTSRSTRIEDTSHKPQVYAEIGVKELFLYDPTGEYLHPPLQGFRLRGRRYRQIVPDATGRLESKELGIRLYLESADLVLADARTGTILLTESEAERDLRLQEQQLRLQEQRAREAVEARLAQEMAARRALEKELQRLRPQQKRRA